MSSGVMGRPAEGLPTRYDKLAANCLAFVQLASIRLWLRVNESRALDRRLDQPCLTAPAPWQRTIQDWLSMLIASESAPTATRLAAQLASRLNQLRDTDL